MIAAKHARLLSVLEPAETLPPCARAQDHFRKVCTPNYVNVFRDRGGVIGVVEFDTPEDLARAVRLPGPTAASPSTAPPLVLITLLRRA